MRGQRHRRKDLECRAWRKLSRRVLITRDQVVRHGYRGDISRRHWHNSLPSAIFFLSPLFFSFFSLFLSLPPSFFIIVVAGCCMYRKTNRLLIIHRVGGIVSKSPLISRTCILCIHGYKSWSITRRLIFARIDSSRGEWRRSAEKRRRVLEVCTFDPRPWLRPSDTRSVE